MILTTNHPSTVKHSTPLLVAAILSTALIPAARGATLFSDDFEGYAADTLLTTSGPWGTAGLGDANVFIRDELTDTPFGTPNQYLDLNDDSATASVRIQSPDLAAASGALTTLVFDFNEPSTGGNGTLIVGYANQGADINLAGRRIAVNLDDGVVTGLSTTAANTYSLNASYTFYMIFNDTASPASYPGGTVAPGSADIWLQPGGGAPVFAGTRTAENTQTAAYRVGLRSFSANLQQVLVDNVSLEEGAVVPEPASLILLGLGGLALVRRRR